jgi:hypothetical protein
VTGYLSAGGAPLSVEPSPDRSEGDAATLRYRKGEILQTPFVPPPMSGIAAGLRPVTEASYAYLYGLITDPRVSVRWRYHGAVPRRDTFVSEIWNRVFSQFLIIDLESSRAIGLALGYQASLRNGTLWIAGVTDPDFHGERASLEGLFLFVKYLFATWPLRKLYMEIPEFNLSQFGSGLRRLWHEEGRLRGEIYYHNERWDTVTVALYRNELEGSPLLQRVIGMADLASRTG